MTISHGQVSERVGSSHGRLPGGGDALAEGWAGENRQASKKEAALQGCSGGADVGECWREKYFPCTLITDETQ